MTGPVVFETMGTVVSVRGVDDAVRDAVQSVFAAADARYSLYRPDSELSRLARGELRLAEASAELRKMYELANDWRLATDGAFSAHRPDGVIDLSGVVKAWAIREAADLLAAAGEADWCLNAGGDVLTSGTDDAGSPWSIGIVDPLDRGRLLASLAIDAERPAVATSGSAERGDHIWGIGRTGDTFVQVTVCAPDIITADVLATAIVAAGPEGLDGFTSSWPIDVLAVTACSELLATPGMRAGVLASR